MCMGHINLDTFKQETHSISFYQISNWGALKIIYQIKSQLDSIEVFHD